MLIAAAIGFAFGFVGSIPVAGPIAVLVLNRGLTARFKSGISIGVGAAVAEGAYAFLAFWGFGELLARVSWLDAAAKGASAVIWLVLAVVFLRSQGDVPDETESTSVRSSAWGSAALGFTITATNTTLIATWTAAVTVLFGTSLVTYTPTTSIVFAVSACVGIASWFALMLGLIYRLRKRLSAGCARQGSMGDWTAPPRAESVVCRQRCRVLCVGACWGSPHLPTAGPYTQSSTRSPNTTTTKRPFASGNSATTSAPVVQRPPRVRVQIHQLARALVEPRREAPLVGLEQPGARLCQALAGADLPDFVGLPETSRVSVVCTRCAMNCVVHRRVPRPSSSPASRSPQ